LRSFRYSASATAPGSPAELALSIENVRRNVQICPFHPAAVILATASARNSKLIHTVFRAAALMRDNVDQVR
jgi:hypothetical protein